MHSDLLTALENLVKEYSQQRSPEAMTVKDFCEREQMSTSSFHKLQRNGHGPEVRRLPGMTLLRITAAAYAEWKARMAELQSSKSLQREHEQRVAKRRAAGRLAVESPTHISKQKKRKKRGA